MAKSYLSSQNERSASRKTRDLILQTALKTVSRDGLEGLTIGELAKAVGMSKSGLFAHFGGKDQLQLAVMGLAVERFVDIVLRPAFQAPRGEPRIKAMLDNWLEHLNDESELPGGSVLIAASTELDDRPGELRDYVQKTQKDLISNIEKAARIAVEERHFRKDLDVEQFAWSMYSFVLGYHHFKRMLEDPKAELHLKRSFSGLMDVASDETYKRERRTVRAVSTKPAASTKKQASRRAAGK
jgi:AcrR family transcriptional regulator